MQKEIFIKKHFVDLYENKIICKFYKRIIKCKATSKQNVSMNENIKEYCQQFIESDSTPQFAIFIKGNWGVGKTYFIDSLIEKYKQDNKSETDFKIIKISLFGVSSFEDIDERIFQAMHPKLSSKGMKIVATALRSASKFDSRFDLGVSGLSKVFNAIFARKIKFAKNNVIIVDDFERSI